MDALYNPGDMAKIGVMLTGFGVFFSFLGIMMLLDSAMLTVGNLLFVAGVAIIMGPQRCRTFFLDRRRTRSTVCFFLGILLVMFGWCFIGLVVQGFGGLNLFGNFFPLVIRMLEALPVVGPIMRSAPVQRAAAYFDSNSSRRSV